MTDHPINDINYIPTEQHLSDIKNITARMYNEARERGWCGEFERIIEEVNEDLFVKIEARKLRVYYSATVVTTVRNYFDIDTPETNDEITEKFENDYNQYISNASIDEDAQEIQDVSIDTIQTRYY